MDRIGLGPELTTDQVAAMAAALGLGVTPAALAGTPAIALPCAFTRAGLPIGLQLLARPFDEPTLLRAAYEQDTEWSRWRPSL